jgi:Hypoxia induced protein conserved region
MRIILTIFIVLGALATLAVLVRGVINMANQQNWSPEKSQELMRKRVLYQAVTIVFAVILLLVFSTAH